MSDTHDHLAALEKIVALFNEEGVEQVFHCGDIVAPFTIRVLQKLSAPVTAVYGNNDGELFGLREAFSKIGEITHPPKEVELEGKWFLVDHFVSERHWTALAASGQYFAILFGHTHEVLNTQVDHTIILNPGEGCGYLTGKSTCAIIDTESGTAEIREIE